MNFALNKAQQELREEIVHFAKTHLDEGLEDRDREQRFDRSLWLKCGEMGLQGMPVPKDLGGQGLDPLSVIIGLEALGYGCRDNGLTFALGAHLLACVVPLWKFGRKEQQEKYLPRLCDGTWVATHAITETQSGSDVFKMQTTAILTGADYSINGEKNYCSNAPVADVALVYALTNPDKGALGGISSFFLEKEKSQFVSSEKIEKMGLRSCLMGRLSLDQVQVPASAVLGKPGGGMIQFSQSMTWERIGLSALHIGTMERLLEKTKEYARSRTVFGQPIGKYQAISHQLAELEMMLEAGRLLVYKAAWKLREGQAATVEASLAKLFVSEMYKNQTMNLLQIFGASGYVGNSDIERSVRDAAAATLYSGTSEIQKNIIAKYLKL